MPDVRLPDGASKPRPIGAPMEGISLRFSVTALVVYAAGYFVLIQMLLAAWAE